MRQKIEEYINQFIKVEFQGQFSGDFFSEADVRSVLYTRIKDGFQSIRRKFPIENNLNDAYKKEFQTDLVKAEYSYEDYQSNIRKAFDIAILHEDNNVWIGSDKWINFHIPRKREAQMFWNQPIRYGIEIKAESHSKDISKAIKNLKIDQEKMRGYLVSDYCKNNFLDQDGFNLPFEGCAILFIQHEKVEKNFELVEYVKLGKHCDAFCVTPSNIYKVNF